jgi:Fic family protein
MQYLGQEIDNIVEACNLIGQTVLQAKSGPISVDEIRGYNRLVLRNLPLLDGVVPGELRKHSVGVGGYRAVPQEDCEFLLGQFCTWLNDLKLPGSLEVPYSILAAIAAHLYFVWIHPFGDGNGRTARLIEFRYLLQAGFPTPAAHLLSNFYNMTRAKYYQQLDNASRSNGRMEDFIAYALEGLVDQLREQLRVIRESQLQVTWHNYVHERFTTSSRTDVRRRNLVLELSKVMVNEGWVKTSDLPELSARVAQAYSAKTQKTLSRDLNALSEMGLVERGGRKVRANRNLILAFLPDRLVADS